MADPKQDWLNPEHYDDVDIDDPENPEMTQEDFARGKPFREVFPEIYAQWVAQQAVSLTLSPATIAAFAQDGDDWKERMVEALDEAARKKQAA